MIRSNLRCNEKEISQVSTKLPSSKEGILQKKGPSKGQGEIHRCECIRMENISNL